MNPKKSEGASIREPNQESETLVGANEAKEQHSENAITQMRIAHPARYVSLLDQGSVGAIGDFQQYKAAPRVLSTTRRQAAQVDAWINLLSDLKRALSQPHNNDLYRYAFFDTYAQFSGNELMTMATDTLLVSTKEVLLSGNGRDNYKEAVEKLLEVFKSGATEVRVLNWVDETENVMG